MSEQTSSAAQSPAKARRPRSGRRTAVRLVLMLAVLGGLAYALAERWHAVRPQLARFGPWPVLGAVLAILVSLLLSMGAWRAVLDDLGSRLAFRDAARIFFVGQLGKYLPGSVWPVVVQMEMGHDLGLPRARMAVAGIVTIGISVVTGAGLGLLVIPALLGHGGWLWLVLLLLPLVALVLHPRVLNVLLRLAGRITRRAALERPLTGRGIARAATWQLGSWVLIGLHAWLLLLALGADAWSAIPVGLGGFALAQTAGLLFIIAPAGVGPRDALAVVFFRSVLGSTSAAVAVALVSRLVVTLADAFAAGVAGVGARRRRSKVSRGEGYGDGADRGVAAVPGALPTGASPENLP